MNEEVTVAWRVDESGLSCRIWSGVTDEMLEVIREEFIAALSLPREEVVVISRRALRSRPWPRIILIRREPLPLSLQSEESVARRMLRRIVMEHLGS